MEKVLVTNAAQIVTPVGRTARFGSDMREVTEYKDGAVYICDGIIKSIGTMEDVYRYMVSENGHDLMDGVTVIDAEGKAVILITSVLIATRSALQPSFISPTGRSSISAPFFVPMRNASL